MVISKNDNGTEVSVKSSDTIEVRLEAHGGTGFVWGLEGLNAEYLEVLKEETKSETGPGLTGGTLTYTWMIRPKKPGTTEITMYYYRPWEGKNKPADRFTVRLRVLP